MNKEYTAAQIEEVEQYVAGQLSAAEQIAFEQRMQEDEALRLLVRQQQLLLESVQLSALAEERAELQAIHKAIFEAEEATGGKIVPMQRPKSYRSILRIAAFLVLGVLLGALGASILQNGKKDAIAVVDTPKEGDDEFGGVPDGLSVFDGYTTILLESGEEGNYDTLNDKILLTIFKNQESQFDYTLTDNQLRLFFPQLPTVASWETVEATLIVERLEQLDLKVALLQLNDQLFSIPLTDEAFTQLENF